jgi:hypothetical protein
MEPAAIAVIAALVAVIPRLIQGLREPEKGAVGGRGARGRAVERESADRAPRAAAARGTGLVAVLREVNWLAVIAATGTLATVVVCFMIIFDLGRERPFTEDDRKWAQGIVASVVSFWIGVAVGKK